MANYNPDTSGLISLADRPNNERTMIQSAGGIASGRKRKEIKRISEIVYGIRQESEEDPIETAIKSLFFDLNSPITSTNDIIKGLNFIKEMEKTNQSASQQIVYKYVTPEEIKAIDEHIDSVIGDTNDEPDNEII